MREAGCSRLVFSSTGAVYGNADSKALPENYPCAPINPYGASKWMIERVLSDYRGAMGSDRSRCAISTPAAPIPPAASASSAKWKPISFRCAMMALQGHVPDFAVFGDDYATPDGTAIRDYIHVTDLAAAHVLALKLLLDGHSGGVFDLGTGKGFSVRGDPRRRSRARPGAKSRTSSSHAAPATRPIWSRTLPPRTKRCTSSPPCLFGYSATIIRTAWAWHRKAHPLKNG